MALLAIKGHPTRGKGVIELLEMLGGDNEYNKTGSVHYEFYYIGHLNRICSLPISESYRTYVIFTLEEFLEKFPYKVGDKVSSKYLKNYKVSKMEWESVNNRVIYKLQGMGWYSANELQPYEKETMDKANKAVFDANAQCCDIMNHLIKKETMEEIKIDIPKGYEFAGVDDDKQQVVFTKIGYHYPKTYEECYDILGLLKPENDDSNIFGYRTPLLSKFQKLLVCRDAYWKIAGEQMGLDKPWEPDYNEESYEQGSPIKHVIYYTGTYITKGQKCTPSYILAFPTAEMRDAFKVNFDDDIEFCKEFL